MTTKEYVEQLRSELHRHNHNYYVLNAPEITDFEFIRVDAFSGDRRESFFADAE